MSDPVPHKSRDIKSLQDIYPTPKTYEQRKEDQRRRDERRRARRPRHAPIRVGVASSVLFFALLALLSRLTLLWSGGLAGVSMSFLAVIFLLLCGFLLLRYINTVCDQYSITPAPFYIVWVTVSFAGAGVTLNWLGGDVALWVALVQGVLTGLTLGIVLGVARRREG